MNNLFNLEYYEKKLQNISVKIGKAKDVFLNNQIYETDKFIKGQQELGNEYIETQKEIEKFKNEKEQKDFPQSKNSL